MSELRELVVLSLEPWDRIWRRNQLLIDALLVDEPTFGCCSSNHPPQRETPASRIQDQQWAHSSPRNCDAVSVFQPVGWLPDRLLPYAPWDGGRGIRRRASELGFERPVLWVNNHSLARFAVRTGWPIVYDITDDWLLIESGVARRRRARLTDNCSSSRPRPSRSARQRLQSLGDPLGPFS